MHAAFPQYFVTGANKPPAIFLISGVWYSNQKSRLFFVGIEMIRRFLNLQPDNVAVRVSKVAPRPVFQPADAVAGLHYQCCMNK